MTLASLVHHLPATGLAQLFLDLSFYRPRSNLALCGCFVEGCASTTGYWGPWMYGKPRARPRGEPTLGRPCCIDFCQYRNAGTDAASLEFLLEVVPKRRMRVFLRVRLIRSVVIPPRPLCRLIRRPGLEPLAGCETYWEFFTSSLCCNSNSSLLPMR